MSLETRVLYEFGKFRCIPPEHLLLFEDKPVSLSPKSFEILVALIQSWESCISFCIPPTSGANRIYPPSRALRRLLNFRKFSITLVWSAMSLSPP
jgi:hypothetical protein